MKTSRGVEDYLEAAYLIKREKGNVRVKDMALHLGVSLPSVTEITRKIAAKNLASYERYGPIELTSRGEIIAKRVYSKHRLLAKFFMLLGVDEKTALHDACLAEHVLSQKTLDKLRIFVRKMDRKV